MSKYNLTDILNEYVGGSRHGTIKISYRDLQDAMDTIERQGDFVVRELPGPSGDGKTNREFEVVYIGNVRKSGKEEGGFTVYDYKFGFDPGSQEHFDEEYDFSIGGNNKKNALILARDLLGPAVKGYFGDDQKIINSYTPQMANDVIMSLDRNMDDEGEMTDYAADVEIDNMESSLVEQNVSARFLGSVPYIIRTQVLLATNLEGKGYVPQTVDPTTGFPTSSEEIYKVLEDVYRNGTINLEGTFYISPSDARQTYLLEDGKMTMARSWFQVERPDDIYGLMMDLKKDLDSAAGNLSSMDGVSVQVAGLSYERYVYMLEITDSFQESLVVAIILAFFIVLFVLRDVRLSIITILPVVAITLWLRGGMVLTDTPINLVTVQISSLAIGLGVDYAIHMVQRVREARFENPELKQVEWMEESLDETGNNVAMSAFTDFAGFMVLTLSIMPLFVTFGMIMAIMIFLSFVAAVIMLPALLLQFGNLERQV